MAGHRFDLPTIGFGQPIREIVVTAGFAVIVLAVCVAVSMIVALVEPGPAGHHQAGLHARDRTTLVRPIDAHPAAHRAALGPRLRR